MEQKLMYVVGETANFVKSPYGYDEVYGIEKYSGVMCRDKAVFRLDLLYGLQDYFSEETIRLSRAAVYKLISGHISDKKLISDGLIFLYDNDRVFRKWLGESIYFDGVPDNISLYRYFIECIYKRVEDCISSTWNMIKTYATGYMMHMGYMYVFIPDYDFVATVPHGFAEEVISSAKAWRGHFKKE